MYKKLKLLIAFFLVLTIQVSAINDSKNLNFEKEIAESKKLLNVDSKKAVKKLNDLKQKAVEIGDQKIAFEISYQLVLVYMNVTSDFDKSIEEVYTMIDYAKSTGDYYILADIYQMRGISYISLNLLDKGYDDLKKSITYLNKMESSDKVYFKKSIVYNNISDYFNGLGDTENELKYRRKSYSSANQIVGKDKGALRDKKIMQGFINLQIGNILEGKNSLDSAKFYYTKAEILFDKYGNEYTLYGKIETLKGMSTVYYNQNNFNDAIKYANSALHFHNSQSQPETRRDLYSLLYKSYFEINKQDSSKKYLELFTKLNDSILKLSMNKQNKAVRSIIKENDEEKTTREITIITVSVVLIILLALLGFIYVRRDKTKQKKKYNELLSKIESNKPDKVIDNKTLVTNSINNATLNQILIGLEDFEKSKGYLNSNISLGQLASDLNTNTKYLSNVINEQKGSNFNHYINELRIQYIVEELYHNPKMRLYKIASLAEISGFSSREVFTTIFKKNTGVLPSYFIKQLNQDNRI